MATRYAMAPPKGIADTLNEAADANERGLDSDRKSALTMSQLQGEDQRQRLADSREGREATEFGYKEGVYKDEAEKRDRSKKMLTEISDIGRSIYEVKETIPGAISTDVDGKQIRAADTSRTRVINPTDNSPESIQATSKWLSEVARVRMKYGDFSPEQLKAFQEQSDWATKRGFRGAFEKYQISGDAKDLGPIAQAYGVEPGSFQVRTVTKNGIPSIVAEGTKVDEKGGKTVVQKDLEPWLAMMGITEPTAAINTQIDRGAKLANTQQSKDSGRAALMQGEAALENAKTNKGKASAKIASADASTQLSRLESTYKGNNFAPQFTSLDATGKPQPVQDDEASNIVTRLGNALIDSADMTGGQAHVRARSTLGEINGRAIEEFNERKRTIDGAWGALRKGKTFEMPDGSVLDPKNQDHLQRAKKEFNKFDENGIQVWQGIRNGLANNALKELTKPAPAQAMPTQR